MTLSIRLLSPHVAIITHRPGWLALFGREERIYYAVRDARGVYWELKDERADRAVSWRVQHAIEQKLASQLGLAVSQ